MYHNVSNASFDNGSYPFLSVDCTIYRIAPQHLFPRPCHAQHTLQTSGIDDLRWDMLGPVHHFGDGKITVFPNFMASSTNSHDKSPTKKVVQPLMELVHEYSIKK
jgi:hypothetical protein